MYTRIFQDLLSLNGFRTQSDTFFNRGMAPSLSTRARRCRCSTAPNCGSSSSRPTT